MYRPKKILVVGGGGREHALAWRLSRDENPAELYAAPGNPGIAQLATCLPIQATDVRALLDFAHGERIDLTVVGPEAPLMAGIVDAFTEAKLPIVGPTRAAAELEGSKAFAKTLCRTHAIPTPEFKVFTDFEKARAHITASSGGMVVKADGLCAGKGVYVCDLPSEALAAAERLLVKGELGEAGRRILVEDRIQGDELSVFALTDGETILRFGESRDHKRLSEGDKGPNTGGMGAISPVPGVADETLDRVEREILVPIIHAMRVEGRPFRGVLFAGLMLTPAGPKVLEFNVRFGDPETQALLPRLTGDFTGALGLLASGRLDEARLEWDPRTAVAVVAAAPGYPEKPRTGDPVEGLGEGLVFQAGTALQGGRVVTAGGRVLAATGMGEDLEAARAEAYAALDRIRFPGMQVRRDIGLSTARVVNVRGRGL